VVFVKNSVGRGGRNFAQLKFRTMVRNAEEQTGPIPARQTDQRILRSGRFLRKTALDELPQLLNILLGEMSFVGPRPLRTVVVREYLVQLPAFADRHRVQPGLAGLAQVVGDYYVPLRSRLRLDRLYAEHAGLALDLKLLWLAMTIVFWYRWKRGWTGRLPRHWLHARPG
jgi:lipopolysaccharide/colanic/teichoic acid biosynthesis glycosyltransferase